MSMSRAVPIFGSRTHARVARSPSRPVAHAGPGTGSGAASREPAVEARRAGPGGTLAHSRGTHLRPRCRAPRSTARIRALCSIYAVRALDNGVARGRAFGNVRMSTDPREMPTAAAHCFLGKSICLTTGSCSMYTSSSRAPRVLVHTMVPCRAVTTTPGPDATFGMISGCSGGWGSHSPQQCANVPCFVAAAKQDWTFYGEISLPYQRADSSVRV